MSTAWGICDIGEERTRPQTHIQHYFIVYQNKYNRSCQSCISSVDLKLGGRSWMYAAMIARVFHNRIPKFIIQKALPGPGSTSLLLARHSNPKYMSLVKKITIKSILKKRVLFWYSLCYLVFADGLLHRLTNLRLWYNHTCSHILIYINTEHGSISSVA